MQVVFEALSFFFPAPNKSFMLQIIIMELCGFTEMTIVLKWLLVVYLFFITNVLVENTQISNQLWTAYMYIKWYFLFYNKWNQKLLASLRVCLYSKVFCSKLFILLFHGGEMYGYWAVTSYVMALKIWKCPPSYAVSPTLLIFKNQVNCPLYFGALGGY